MSKKDITIVRVYLKERHDLIADILAWLESTQLKGFTVFRGIAGLGDSHQLHTATLVDLSLDLPVVIEFFDEPKTVEKICQELGKMVKVQHIISWTAQAGI